MRILDKDGGELMAPDMEKGRLVPERLLVARHPAVEAVAEAGHYEIAAVYENGGREAVWVVDVPGVKGSEPWDEYENIYRYVLYTPEELAAMEAVRNAPTAEERLEELEQALEMLLAGVTE